jgi:Spy/CpxP family protein refolding chaperone
MRGTVALLFALSLLSAPALAQDAKPDEKKTEKKAEPRRGPPRGGMGGNPADFTKNAVEFLAKELDLTDTQRKEVETIFSDMMSDIWKKAGQFFGSGDPEDRKKARKLFEDMRINLSKKISKVLTPSQKREFEVLVENFDRRAQGFEQGRRVREDISQLFNPKPQSKRISMGKAERLLFLSPEETAVILPFVEKVIDKKLALYEGRRVRRKDLLNATRGGANKKEIAERMGEIRAAEQFQRLEIAASMARLRDLLTLEQEVRFVASGIID